MNMSNDRNIVKISEFCQRSVRGRRRRRQGTVHHEGVSQEENTNDAGPTLDDSIVTIPFERLEYTIQSSPWDITERDGEMVLGGTVVNVSILKSLPEEESPNSMKNVGATLDEYATIYTHDVQLLIAIGAFNGSLCIISREGGDPSSRRLWAPVIIKVQHLGNNIATESTLGFHHVFIPPNIAATIGVHDFGCLELPMKAEICSLSQKMTIPPPMKMDPQITMPTSIDPLLVGIPLAKKAFLVECFCPPTDCLPSSLELLFAAIQNEEYVKRYRKEMDSKHIDKLRKFFFRKDGDDKNKPISRLVTIGSIIAVVDDGPNIIKSQSKCLVGTNIRTMIRYYKVDEVEMEDKGIIFYNVPPSISANFCKISPSTELILHSDGQKGKSKSNQVSQMPQLSSTFLFHQSTREKQEIPYNTLMRAMWSHPNLQEIVETLAAMKDTVLRSTRSRCNYGFIGSLSRHMLHIIGHEDNHIKHCLDVAADSVGMNIFHVTGLACFGFHYKVLSGDNHKRNVVGSISDKISGLKAAFQIALKSLPCIVHVAFDGEIEADDISIKHDEEQRIVSCLQHELSNAYSQLEDVPQVIIIISTEKKLEPGPLSFMIMLDSILIDQPDECYAKELWNDNDTFHSIKNDVIGRSAKEIHHLGHQVRAMERIELGGLEGVACSTRNAILDVLNRREKINIFRSSSQRFSSNLIPKIQWDDIGGLSYVRDEIIDAIELPLKYPKLFVKSRRSGILLFGPPGSGKTLVAKAVASECGLPFLSVKGPELLGSYVGESEANIRSVFDNVREVAKTCSSKDFRGAAILFFDEIDSLAPRRGELGDGGGVMERAVSTLLGEMDKVVSDDNTDSNSGHVFVIAATNRPDLLDASLLRPGRFDRAIYLGLARERADRIQILAAQIRKFKFENGEDPISIASKVVDSIPESLSGADFSGIASGALMLSLQRTCEEADREAEAKGSTLEDILINWPKEKLTPSVKVDDFLVAAKTVHPSINSSDLSKYDAMRIEFCSPQTSSNK